jgi:aminoglycoside/choline kinase family phosphotransferase
MSRFVRTTQLLAAVEVRVPRVVAQDLPRGWLLVEDLGPLTLYEASLAGPALEVRVAQAAEVARRIASLDAASVGALSPPLDREVLEAEVARTVAVALRPLGLLDTREEALLSTAVAHLCARLGETLRPIHRDFMVRNLVPLEGEVGVLDHQDLRLGPAEYDLASLLTDSLLVDGACRARLERELVPVSDRARWSAAVAQRSLKIIGTFVSFAERGSRRHLVLVPRALATLARIAPEVPELTPWTLRFASWEAAIVPRLGLEVEPQASLDR